MSRVLAVLLNCVNELGLRGATETLRRDEASHDDIASGLFLKLMEYTLRKDEKLASIAKGISKNAKCTSKDVQNEIIETLANMVLGDIRKKYEHADSVGFCLKSDQGQVQGGQFVSCSSLCQQFHARGASYWVA